ncbi:MAG: tetratricopeptide repeat protein [Catalinimonas sp.]
MKREIYVVVAVAGLLMVGLFFLPPAVVSNKEATEAVPAEASAAVPNDHPTTAAPTEVHQRLQTAYADANNAEKAIFADSLANLYRREGRFDSAAAYRNRALTSQQTFARVIAAADDHYEAFTYATDPDKRRTYNERARTYYQQLLEERPEDLDIRSKLAMTYVAGETPMEGIMMLREVLERDAQNATALYNLGILAMQTGQYERAVERLSKLVKAHPEHVEGRFYLALNQRELGLAEEAKMNLRRVRELSDDPALRASVETYLSELEG